MAAVSSTTLPGAVEDSEPSTELSLEVTLNPEDLHNRPKPATTEWIDIACTGLNEKRILHWTPPLVWSELCYEYAKRQADTCMSTGKLKHGLTDTCQGRFGQCILGPKDGGPFRMNAKSMEKIVDLWYNKEIANYKFDAPGHHEKSANFEQVVWFGSTSIGMALSQNGRYVVCNFFPAGPDSSNEAPADKGRRNYFPPGHEVLQMTNPEKYRSWFKTNVLPLQEGPAPWIGGEIRAETPPEEEKPKTGGSAKKPGSAKDSRSGSAKAKSKSKSPKGKKGDTTQGLGRTTSRGKSPDRKKKGVTQKVDVKLMSPARKASPTATAGKSRSKSPTRKNVSAAN